MMVKQITFNAQIAKDLADGNFVSVTDSLHFKWEITKKITINNTGKIFPIRLDQNGFRYDNIISSAFTVLSLVDKNL